MSLRARRARTAVIAVFACLGAARLLAQAIPQTRYQPTEIEVKAAFLYHFAQLVTWPEGPEADPAAPVVVAVVGPDPFGERLETTIGAETVRGRPIKIVRVTAVSELTTPPHILFCGYGERAEIDRVLAAAAKMPTLTVGSSAGFAKRGGMIEFRLTPDRRVTFDINAQVAAGSGLKVSSQLLKIARIVESAR